MNILSGNIYNIYYLPTTLDLKLIFLDQRVAALTGYEPQDLIEKTLYQYIHATDMVPMRLTHLTRKYFYTSENIFVHFVHWLQCCTRARRAAGTTGG